MEALSSEYLTVVPRAQGVEEKENFKTPDDTENFTLIRLLGTFTVRDADNEPLSQPSAVRLTAIYTSDDVAEVPEGQRLLLGIHFPQETLLWASPVPEYPERSPFAGFWQGSGWFTFVIDNPDPEVGGQFTVDISGNLGDPVVGAGSG